jgi:DNA primase
VVATTLVCRNTCCPTFDSAPSFLRWCGPANMANLEIHPFLARVPDVERPDFTVFDRDASAGVDILGSTKVAFLLKQALGAVGLQSWANVSSRRAFRCTFRRRPSSFFFEPAAALKRLGKLGNCFMRAPGVPCRFAKAR